MLMSGLSLSAKLEPGVKEVDFGHLIESEGPKTQRVEVKNTGEEPVSIIRIRPTCGCTAVDYFTDEIMPGQSGWIDVEYNPAGRSGAFEKAIKIYTSEAEVITLPITGLIQSSAETLASKFPKEAGPLRLTETRVFTPKIKKGEMKTVFVNLYNNSDSPVTPEVEVEDKALDAQLVPEKIGAWERGSIGIFVDASRESRTGAIIYKLKFYPEGKAHGDEPTVIEIMADIES